MHCLLLPWQQWAMVALHCCLGNAGNVGQWFGVQLLPNVVAWRFNPPSCSSKPVHCLELDHLLFLNRIIFQQGRQCPSNGAGMLHSRELQPAHQRALRRKSKFTTSHITIITTAYELPVLEFHILDSFESDVLLNIMDRPQLR